MIQTLFDHLALCKHNLGRAEHHVTGGRANDAIEFAKELASRATALVEALEAHLKAAKDA